jgi:thiamine biosynthesis lipoprotein
VHPKYKLSNSQVLREATAAVEAEVEALQPREAPDLLQRRAFRAMGCEMVTILACEDDLKGILERVPGWFEEWEQVLSRFRFDSELTRLNQAPDQPVQVSNVLWDVYQAAMQAEQLTGGLVTPTVARAVIKSGYDRSFDLLPKDQPRIPWEISNEVEDFSMVIANSDKHSLCLPPGIQLDFGGVAKGWAAHQAMLKLRGSGPVLVDAGGDIAISGSLPGSVPWPVGVADPIHPGREIAVLYLEECGVATSGKDRRQWMHGGRMAHHIIDPRSGQPALTDVMTVTVVAPTVMEAEAAAKAALILGSEEGLAWIQESTSMAGLFVLDDGQVLASEGMKVYLGS